MLHWKILMAGASIAGALAGAATLQSASVGHLKRSGVVRISSHSTAAIDPDAMAALDNMAKYLRTLKAVQVHAVVTSEDVTEDGQKVQSMSTIEMVAERPNRLRAEVLNDLAPRYFFYDGKKFTLWAPMPQYYASFDAPPTINALADVLEDKYNIDLPLVDLFRWGTPGSDFHDVTNAMDIGPSAVDGTTCEQYAFRQEGLDWQVWIQRGDNPLPRRLVLTTTTDDARPQHESTWTWNLAPSYNDSTFIFTPPTGAKKISFDTVAARREAKKPGGGQ